MNRSGSSEFEHENSKESKPNSCSEKREEYPGSISGRQKNKQYTFTHEYKPMAGESNLSKCLIKNITNLRNLYPLEEL